MAITIFGLLFHVNSNNTFQNNPDRSVVKKIPVAQSLNQLTFSKNCDLNSKTLTSEVKLWTLMKAKSMTFYVLMLT